MNKKKMIMNYLAILLLFLASACGTFENPAIQTTIEAWDAVAASSIRLMITLPCLLSMITMVLIGTIVGKKISYKMVTLIGSVFIFIGGVFPFVIHTNWTIVLVFRALLGIGVGCYSLRNPLLVKSVPPEQLAKFIGYGNVISSFMSVIISPLVGHLTSYGWQYAFLSNIFVIITGLMALFFLKEPETIEEETTIEKQKIKIPKTVLFYIVIQFFATMALYPLLSGMSSYLNELGIGSATIAGYMLSLYTFGGVITNIYLSKIQKKLKDSVLCIAFSLPAIGTSIVLLNQNIGILALGVLISGIGFTTIFSMLQVLNGRICDAYSVAQASTLILAANQLGVFLSSYFIDFSTKMNIFEIEMRNPYFICVIVYIILASICLIYRKKIIPQTKI